MGEKVGWGLVWVGSVEVAKKGSGCSVEFASSRSVEKGRGDGEDGEEGGVDGVGVVGAGGGEEGGPDGHSLGEKDGDGVAGD